MISNTWPRVVYLRDCEIETGDWCCRSMELTYLISRGTSWLGLMRKSAKI